MRNRPALRAEKGYSCVGIRNLELTTSQSKDWTSPDGKVPLARGQAKRLAADLPEGGAFRRATACRRGYRAATRGATPQPVAASSVVIGKLLLMGKFRFQK